jgi:hypothetical protein
MRMQDVQEIPRFRPVVATAIGLPFLLFGGYIAYFIVPVIVRIVLVAVVRTVTGA